MAGAILCADVDRQLFRILEKAFREEGFRAIPAHDGEEALALVEEERPAIVILDITLAKRDGFEVLEAIRALPDPVGQVPVLLTSRSRITPSYEARARALSAQALLAKPVPLKSLLSRVREHAKAEPPSVARSSRSPREGQRVEGTLAEIGFPHLLHHLHGLRATGVLMMSAGKKKKAIQMSDGYPVAVKSNLVHECLGNYLVRTGRLSREAVAESLGRMKEGEGLQGEILVAMEVITGDEIGAALREQARDKLFEIFEWPGGRFKLELGGRLMRGNSLALDGSPAEIILQGVRERTRGETVDAFHDLYRDRFVARGQSPFYRFQEVDLRPEEEALVRGLDGTLTLSALAGEDEAMRRALYGLLATELLVLRSGPEESDDLIQTRSLVIPPKPRTGPRREDRRLRAELARLADELRGKGYFEMLGVDPGAPDEDIEHAYERLAKQVHPDRFHHASSSVKDLAEELFELVTQAHDTLLDPKRRANHLRSQKAEMKTAVQEARSQRLIQAEVEFQEGEAKLRQRDYEGALAHFSKAREAAPREGEYLAHYGWCLHLCNPDSPTVVQEAIAHVKRAAALARNQEKPYLFLGRLLNAVGDTAAAERMFTRAVQIQPECVEAIRELRLINMRRGKGLIGRLLRR